MLILTVVVAFQIDDAVSFAHQKILLHPASRRQASFAIHAKPVADTAESTTSSTSPSQSISLGSRSSIQCEHFDSCPGCVVQDDVFDIPVLQSARRFFSSPSIQQHRWRSRAEGDSAGEEGSVFNTVLPTASTTKWRTQAKLAATAASSAWGSRDGCAFGLFERRSHKVTTIPNCEVHHPRINQAVELLQLATRKAKVIPYNENLGTGHLRYIQCQVERLNGQDKICLTLVWNAAQYKQSQPTLSRLVKELKRLESLEREQEGASSFQFHSIWLHLNTSAGNAIFSRGANNWYRVDGPEFVREELPQEEDANINAIASSPSIKNGLLYFTPNAFRQANMDGFEKIALQVAKAVPPSSAVCELYAGVGMLGLTALSYAHNKDAHLRFLRCSDENDANPRCFDRAVQSLPTEITGRPPRDRRSFAKKGKDKDKKSPRNNQRRGPKKKEPTLADLFDGNLGDDYNSMNNGRREITYMVASAAKALQEGQAIGANVIVVDPPRRGLEEEVIAELCKPINPDQDVEDELMFLLDDDDDDTNNGRTNKCNDATTLIYVSCGFDALARDCERLLLAQGAGWKLESATGYVLFPGSDHVETVAIFKRKDPARFDTDSRRKPKTSKRRF
jgi:23S rRNA (uracil1939-C5)-methyltransferase